MFPCRCLGITCAPLCAGMKRIFCSPFSCYLIVAMAFNLTPISFGIKHLLSGEFTCLAVRWTFINAIFCAVNIAAAFYMSSAILDENTYKESNAQTRSTFERAKYMFCYDPVVAFLIIVRIAFVYWLVLGITWSANGKILNECNGVDNSASVWMSISLGFSYLGLGLTFFLLSLCCAPKGNSDPRRFAHDYMKKSFRKDQELVTGVYEQPYTQAKEEKIDIETQKKPPETQSVEYAEKQKTMPHMVLW